MRKSKRREEEEGQGDSFSSIDSLSSLPSPFFQPIGLRKAGIADPKKNVSFDMLLLSRKPFQTFLQKLSLSLNTGSFAFALSSVLADLSSSLSRLPGKN